MNEYGWGVATGMVFIILVVFFAGAELHRKWRAYEKRTANFLMFPRNEIYVSKALLDHTHEWISQGERNEPWGMLITVTKCRICGLKAEKTIQPLKRNEHEWTEERVTTTQWGHVGMRERCKHCGIARKDTIGYCPCIRPGEWIDCKQHLPPYGERVLTKLRSHESLPTFNLLQRVDNGDGTWVWCADDHSIRDATAWMRVQP